MTLEHIVWDWNGTLLNDLWAVVEATNHSLKDYRVSKLSIADYRRTFRRPAKAFHDDLVGRTLSESEWQAIDQNYWRHYDTLLSRIQLTPTSSDTLGEIDSIGLRQSLLSMTPDERLVPQVAQYSIGRYFRLIEGRRSGDGTRKALLLARHLQNLGIYPASAIVVGDTTDDFLSAKAVGAGCILVTAYAFEDEDRHFEADCVVSTINDVIEVISRS